MTKQQQKRLAELEKKKSLTKNEKVELDHLRRVAQTVIVKK